MSSPTCASGEVDAASSCRIAIRRRCSGVPAFGRPSMPKIPAEDHVERDGLHAGREREGPVHRPAVDPPRGDVGDHLGVARDGVAVEGGQQQLALAHVALADRGERGVRPDDRPQRRLAGQRRRLLGLRGEQRAHVVRVAGDDGVAADDPVHPEDVAELAAGAEHELDLALAEAQDLERAREDDLRRRGERQREVRQRPGGGGRSLADEAVGGRCDWLGDLRGHADRPRYTRYAGNQT